MSDPAILVTDIKKSYPRRGGPGRELILAGVSMRAEVGKITVLMGQSGCGKSTLFRILTGEEVQDEGQVTMLGNIVDAKDRRSFEEVKRRFGILFQHGALFQSMTVGQNIAFPIIEHWPQFAPDTVSEIVDIKLRQVRLDPAIYREKLPGSLSGGERKRVGLARALALDPKLVLYDEPSAGLDPIVSRQIDSLIKGLVRVFRMSSLVVTHELESAFAIADHMVLLKRAEKEYRDDWQGTIVYEEGTPDDLMNSTRPYTVDFLGEFSNHGICTVDSCLTVQEKDFKTCSTCGKAATKG